MPEFHHIDMVGNMYAAPTMWQPPAPFYLVLRGKRVEKIVRDYDRQHLIVYCHGGDTVRTDWFTLIEVWREDKQDA